MWSAPKAAVDSTAKMLAQSMTGSQACKAAVMREAGDGYVLRNVSCVEVTGENLLSGGLGSVRRDETSPTG